MSVSGIDVVQNGIAASANAWLTTSQKKLNKISNQLATGLRINTAADDPSGFAIASNLQTQILSYDAASENIQNGQNYISVATGAVSSAIDIVQRLRILAVAASNDTIGIQGRQSLQAEANQLEAELNQIDGNTSFNGQQVFAPTSNISTTPALVQQANYTNPGNNANPASFTLASAPQAGDVLVAIVSHGNQFGGPAPAPTINPPAGWTLVTAMDNNSDTGSYVYYRIAQSGDPTAYTFSQSTADEEYGTILEFSGANTSAPITQYAEAYDTPAARVTPTLTAQQAGQLPIAAISFQNAPVTGSLTSAANWQEILAVGNSASSSEVQVASPTTNGQAETASYLQTSAPKYGYDTILLVNPGQLSQSQLSIQTGIREGDLKSVNVNTIVSSNALSLAGIDLTSFQTAQAAIATCDSALANLTTFQSQLGSVSVTLAQDLDNDNLSSVNLTQAMSNIRDLNVAQGESQFIATKLNISFTTSILAQANLSAQNILQLFR